MWCPHDIGRDNWVWGEQGTLEMISSPHEVGEEALTERSPCWEAFGRPFQIFPESDERRVLVVYVFCWGRYGGSPGPRGIDFTSIFLRKIEVFGPGPGRGPSGAGARA